MAKAILTILWRSRDIMDWPSPSYETITEAGPDVSRVEAEVKESYSKLGLGRFDEEDLSSLATTPI